MMKKSSNRSYCRLMKKFVILGFLLLVKNSTSSDSVDGISYSIVNNQETSTQIAKEFVDDNSGKKQLPNTRNEEGRIVTESSFEWHEYDYLGDYSIAEKCSNVTTQDDSFYHSNFLIMSLLQKGKNATFLNYNDRGRYESLICWLYNLKLNIPDEHFRSGIFSVSIKGMVCTAFQIQSITSTYHPSNQNNTQNDPSISFSISGLSATCSGHYSSGLTSGTVTVILDTIHNTTSIETDTAFQSTFLSNATIIEHYNDKTPYNLFSSVPDDHDCHNITVPKSANITFCETSLLVSSVKFTGSLSAKFIGLFSSSIAKHVTDALDKEICPSIKVAIDEQLNVMLRKMNHYLRNLIRGNNASGSLTLPRYNAHIEKSQNISHDVSSLMTWQSDLVVIKSMLTKFNHFLSSHMDKGFILSFMKWIGWSSSDNQNDQDIKCTSSIDCGLFFRGINGLIRSVTDAGVAKVTNESKHFAYNINKLGNLNMTLSNEEISDLDTLTKIEIIPKYDHMISLVMESHNGFQIKCKVELNMSPLTNGSSDVMIEGATLHESFYVVLNISAVSLQVDVDFGLLREKLQTVNMGDITKMFSSSTKNDTVKLLISTLEYVNVTKLVPDMHVNSFELIPLSTIDQSRNETLEKSLDKAINHFVMLMLNEYSMLWTNVIASLGEGPFRMKLNAFLEKLLSKKSVAEEQSNIWSSIEDEFILHNHLGNYQFFNFSDSTIIHKIHDAFASYSWLNAFNRYLSCVSSYIQKTQHKPNLFSNKTNSFDVDVIDASVGNIDNINQIDILNVVNDTQMVSEIISYWDNQTAHHSSDVNTTSDLLIKLHATFKWSLLDLKTDFTSSLAISGIQNRIGTKLEYDLESFNQQNLYQVLHNPLVLSKPTSQDSGLWDLIFSIGSINLGINVTATFKNDLKYFSYNSLDKQKFGGMITSVLTSVASVAQNSANSVNHILSYKFRDRGSYNEVKERQDELLKSNQSHELSWYLSLGIGVLSFHFYFLKKYTQMNFTVLRERQSNQKVSAIPRSLAFHQRISYPFRYLIPVTVIVTILIFFVSNLSTGASVDLEFAMHDKMIGGSSISFPNIQTFSLGKTVSEMYQAKVYSLMILVLVFSGIWPYVKLLVMLFAWLSNDRWLPFDRRERLLIWLDAFGKYSLVDSFVLVLMLVSFRFHIDLDLPVLTAIDSYVVPRDGFYTFLCATILSLVIGHMVTFLHRYSVMPQIPKNNQSKTESIRNHTFEHKYPYRRLMKLSNRGEWIWLVFNICAIILLVIGAMEKCFIFEFNGLAGLALGIERQAQYSLISLGTSLPLSVRDSSDFGIKCIQWIYFFFALLMPFASLVTVNVLFYVPMTLKNQNRVFVFAEICNAWSAIEVFLLSVLVSMLELSQFASFMVGHRCDFLKGDFLKNLFDEDDTCFSVDSRLNSGSVFLCCGVVMQCLIMFVSLRLSHQVIDERMEREVLTKKAVNNCSVPTDSWFLKLISICLFQALSD